MTLKRLADTIKHLKELVEFSKRDKVRLWKNGTDTAVEVHSSQAVNPNPHGDIK